MRTEEILREIYRMVAELHSRKLEAEGYFSVRQASAFSGLSRDAVRQLIDDGFVKAFQLRPGGNKLIRRREFIAAIEKAKVEPKKRKPSVDEKAEKMWEELAK